MAFVAPMTLLKWINEITKICPLVCVGAVFLQVKIMTTCAYHSLHQAHKTPKRVYFIVHDHQQWSKQITHALHIACTQQ